MRRTTYPNLRTNVFKILEARGVGPGWFAKQVGISYDYLYRIKRGERPIPEHFVTRSQEILALPFDVLFYESVYGAQDEVSRELVEVA